MAPLTIGGSSTGAITLDAGAGGITVSDYLTLSSVAGGATNTGLTLSASNVVESRSIDSRVWGTTLTDASGTPTNGQVAYFTDANTLAGENYLSLTRGGLAMDTSTAANGMLLIGNGAGWNMAYLTPGTAIDISSASGSITITHEDTSSQSSSDNSGTTVVQDISLDAMGHITSIGTVDFSSTFLAISDNDDYWQLGTQGLAP